MSSLVEYFLNSDSSIVKLETLEISHPNFTTTYRLVRNAINGLDAGGEHYDYYPLSIVPAGSSNDLDQVLKVSLGDVGQVLPQELDAIKTADTFNIKPTLLYRTFRSDDLVNILDGPYRFEISNLNFNADGASFEAHAPRLNLTSTGERYTLDRFRALHGFL